MSNILITVSPLESDRWVRSCVATQSHLFLANRENERAIHLQGMNRSPTDGTEANEVDAVPAKVSAPIITPRVEQANLIPGFGIKPLLSRGLSKRTRHTGPCQVVQNRFTFGGKGSHVIHMKSRLLAELGQASSPPFR